MKNQNLTLSADPRLIEAGREYARKHGKSLNQLFREYLASLTRTQGEREFERFVELAKDLKVNSGGYRFTRADAYDD